MLSKAFSTFESNLRIAPVSRTFEQDFYPLEGSGFLCNWVWRLFDRVFHDSRCCKTQFNVKKGEYTLNLIRTNCPIFNSQMQMEQKREDLNCTVWPFK